MKSNLVKIKQTIATRSAIFRRFNKRKE